ncbi:sensor domain-containing diguanylate cyclase [Enterobacter soli]|uniref:sensor domain-containing diguanylate cyclase n=1 Tax=Enterobacter soli TaxID=885040 RepID=UPI00372F687C
MPKRKEENRLFALYALGILDTESEERFDRLTRIAGKLFNVPVSLISLIDKDRQWFKSSRGIDIRSTPRTESFCTYVVEDAGPLIVKDAQKDPRFENNTLVKGIPYIRFYAGYPVKLPDGEIAGSICIIDTKPRNFSADELSLLRDLAEIVEDEFRIMNMATTDSLTALSNRRLFSLITKETLKKSCKRKKVFCVVIIDLNDFKPINDTYGHAEGNQALINFSEILENSSPENSLVARIGGDEFGVLLPYSTIQQANEFINQLSEMLIKHNINADKPYQLTFSAGVVEYDEKVHHDYAAIMRDADEKMYLVKKNKKLLIS